MDVIINKFRYVPLNDADDIFLLNQFPITLTPYMVLSLFSTRFAANAGGTRVSFIQPRLF